jgi:hypothetical protein
MPNENEQPATSDELVAQQARTRMNAGVKLVVKLTFPVLVGVVPWNLAYSSDI